MRELRTSRTIRRSVAFAILGAGVLLAQGCAASTPVKPPSAVDVRNFGAVGNGVTDDSAAISRAFAAAEGKTLYVPAGTYLLTSRLKVPPDLVVKGDGDRSWLKGPVSIGSRDSFSALRIGRAGQACYLGGVADVTFRGVDFVGGGGSFSASWPFLDSHVLTIGVGGGVRGVLFDGCTIERNSGTENASKSRHFDNVFILSHVAANAAIVEDVLFRGCHFAGSPRFNVEVWDEYLMRGGARGSVSIDFSNCVFQASASASIDYSTYRGGYSTITGCTFEGNGAGSNPKWTDDVTIEKGASHITVTGCRALRGRDMFVGGSGGYNVVTHNTVGGDSGVVHDWTPYLVLSGDNNVVTGNTIVSTGPDATVIDVEGNNNIVQNNTVTTPLAKTSAILVMGSGNVASPNVVN